MVGEIRCIWAADCRNWSDLSDAPAWIWPVRRFRNGSALQRSALFRTRPWALHHARSNRIGWRPERLYSAQELSKLDRPPRLGVRKDGHHSFRAEGRIS